MKTITQINWLSVRTVATALGHNAHALFWMDPSGVSKIIRDKAMEGLAELIALVSESEDQSADYRRWRRIDGAPTPAPVAADEEAGI